MKSKVEQNQRLLDQVEEDNKYLKKIIKDIKKVEKNYKDLSNYYQTDWQEDYENRASSEGVTTLLNQDSVWNALEEQYNAKINIIKTITKNL